jgi:hypothetical protein
MQSILYSFFVNSPFQGFQCTRKCEIPFAFCTATAGPPHAAPEANQICVGIGLPPVWLRGAALAEAGMPNGRRVTQLLCVPAVLAVDPLNVAAEHLHDRLDSVP